jgi:hypothetical protein
MTYNWCHGPSCHTNETQDRVRGSKGNKVLRTRKVAINHWNRDTMWRFFCSQGCMLNFVNKHIDSITAIEPRREPLETPIKDPVKETNSNNYGYSWTHTRIEKKEVDNNLNP